MLQLHGIVLYIFCFRSICYYAKHYYQYWYWALVSLEASMMGYLVPCLVSFYP